MQASRGRPALGTRSHVSRRPLEQAPWSLSGQRRIQKGSQPRKMRKNCARAEVLLPAPGGGRTTAIFWQILVLVQEHLRGDFTPTMEMLYD